MQIRHQLGRLPPVRGRHRSLSRSQEKRILDRLELWLLSESLKKLPSQLEEADTIQLDNYEGQ